MQTRLASKFEIKVAVIGYVSAGKTIVINALLRDKYGEVSMKRATSVVNYFRLTTSTDPTVSITPSTSTTTPALKSKTSPSHPLSAIVNKTLKSEDSIGEQTETASSTSDDDFRSAESILKESTIDNAAFRDADQVHVKTYDVKVIEPLCAMRGDDTKLVLVDVPGINEAGAGGKYRKFVADHWDTFDCAIVVMDGRQGANTEEQVDLLEFVHKCNVDYKDIPLIILANKVDDPEDEEQQELVKETRQEVERIFHVTDRENALTLLLEKSSRNGDPLFPVFIPTSALYAFIYRTAAFMTLDQFRTFDKALIDKIGRKELGWKWRTMSDANRVMVAHEAVSDVTLHQDRIESTNFDKVLKALEKAVGGNEVQTKLLKKQTDVSLSKIQKGEKITFHLISIFEKLLALGLPSNDIPQAFWDALVSREKQAFDFLDGSPLHIQEIVSPLQELFQYHEFATSNGWTEQKEHTQAHILWYMRRFIEIVLKYESTATGKSHQSRNEGDTVEWKSLHPLEWLNILQSLLFLSHDKYFYESFGVEKVEIERLVMKWRSLYCEEDVSCYFGRCPSHPSVDLGFNRYCRSCSAFYISENKNHTHDDAFPCFCWRCKQTLSQSCTKCKKCCESFTLPTLKTNAECNLSFLCPNESCKSRLSVNGVCSKCKVMWTLNKNSKCFVCDNPTNADGSCGNRHNCQTYYKCQTLSIALKIHPAPTTLISTLMSCSYNPFDGSFKPQDAEMYKKMIRVEIPKSIADTKHFGHVMWLYCRFMAKLDREVEASTDSTPY